MLRLRSLPLSLFCMLWLMLLLPPVRRTLEGTMSAHMLVHIPALILIGWGVAHNLLVLYPALLRAMRLYRWALLVNGFIVIGIWMIPRLLDLASQNLTIDIFKAITLSIAGGIVNWSWRSTGPIVHGLIHVEFLASLWRLGWIYLASPTRLCTSYGLADQYWLGNTLLIAGAIYATWMALQALMGSDGPITLTTR